MDHVGMHLIFTGCLADTLACIDLVKYLEFEFSGELTSFQCHAKPPFMGEGSLTFGLSQGFSPFVTCGILSIEFDKSILDNFWA